MAIKSRANKRPAPSKLKRKAPTVKREPPIMNLLAAIIRGDPRAIRPTPFELATKAHAGDADAARTILIHCFSILLNCPKPGWQEPLESDFAFHLAAAIEQILEGVDANKALGVKKTRGRPTQKGTEVKREAIAAAFVLLTRLGHRRQSIVDWFDANGIARRTFQRAITENPWASDPALGDRYLTYFANPIAPQITRFIDAKRKR